MTWLTADQQDRAPEPSELDREETWHDFMPFDPRVVVDEPEDDR